MVLRPGHFKRYLLRFIVKMFKKSKTTQKVTEMPSLSKKPVSITQNFPITFSSGRKVSEQPSDMVKLNKKYDQLGKKRRADTNVKRRLSCFSS